MIFTFIILCSEEASFLLNISLHQIYQSSEYLSPCCLLSSLILSWSISIPPVLQSQVRIVITPNAKYWCLLSALSISTLRILPTWVCPNCRLKVLPSEAQIWRPQLTISSWTLNSKQICCTVLLTPSSSPFIQKLFTRQICSIIFSKAFIFVLSSQRVVSVKRNLSSFRSIALEWMVFSSNNQPSFPTTVLNFSLQSVGTPNSTDHLLQSWCSYS